MMQLVPHYPILANGQYGFASQLGIGLPLFVQPIAMPLPITDSNVTEANVDETICTLRFSLTQLCGLQQTTETQNIRQRLENLLSRQQSPSVVKESELLVEKLVKELLLRCKQVHPVEVWSLLRNKGCQFLAPSQSVILQNLIFVLREHKVLPRKTLIEMIVEKCQKTGTDVSKTIVSRVVQLLYRSGCFYIHKDGGIEEKDSQGSKNTRMQLREEFFDYQMLRRTHDGLIVQWAHEEGLYLSADRWSMMLYQDKLHKNYMQSIMDQKAIPLVRWIDALYQHARSVPTVAHCMPVLQEYTSIPAIANSGTDKEKAPEVEVTRSHISKALRCVLSLVNAYIVVAKAPLPQPVAPSARSAAMSGEETLKGRPVFGSRQSPMASPNGLADQELPSPPLSKQAFSSVNISERASPNSFNAYTDVSDRDSDSEGRAQMSPQENPDQRLQEQALLEALRGLVSAMDEPAQAQQQQQQQQIADNYSEWDAWKWSGPHELLKSTQPMVNTEAEMPLQEEDFSTEESLIGPMLSELIDEKNSNNTQLGFTGRTGIGMFNSANCKQKPYARMMSSTAVENLLCAPVAAANTFAPQFRGITSFMRVASLEDESYLHF